MADKKKRTLGDDLRDFRAGKIGDKFYRYNPVPFMVKTDDVKDTIPISTAKSTPLTNGLVNQKSNAVNNTKKIANTMVSMLNNPKTLAEKVKADTPPKAVHTVPSQDQYYQRLANAKNITTVPTKEQQFQYKSDVNTLNQIQQYQNKQKFDNIYSGYNYAQLKAELAKTDSEADKELYSYLENKAYEIATVDDLQKEYAEEIKEWENAPYTKEMEIEGYWDAKGQQIRNKYESLINQKKYEQEKQKKYTDVVSNNIKVLTAIQKYHEAIQQDSPEQITDTYSLQNGNLQKQKYTAEDIEKIKATYESYKDKGFDMDTLYEYYRRELEEKKNAQKIENLKEFGKEHPVLSSVGSVITNTVGSVGDAFMYLGAGLNKLGGGDGYIDPNSTAVAQAQAIRQGVSEKINNPLGEFLYNTGMSMADFLSVLPLSAVPGLGQASITLLGTSAGVSAANEVINNGGDISHALTTGVFAGGAEALFEHFSLDKLKALQSTSPSNINKVIRNALKQGIVEASEESLTEIANGITDWLINADLSNWSIQYNRYLEQGYSESTAWKMTAGDFAKQVGLSAAGGFISGDAIGFGGSMLSYGGYKLQQRDIEKLKNKETRKQLAEEALVSEDFDLNNLIAQGKISGNAKAVKLANSIERTIANSGKEKITAGDVGNLMYLMSLDNSNNNYEVENTEKQEIINDNYTMGGTQKNEAVNATQQPAENKNSEKITDAFGEAHPRGLNVKTRTGGTLTVLGIESSAKDFGASDNNVILVTDNGGKINADDVTPLLPHFQQLFNYAKNFDTIGAKNFVKEYESYLNNAKKSGKNASVEGYAKAFEDLYSLGKMGVTYDSVKASGAYESAISTLGGGIAYNATLTGNLDTNVNRQYETNQIQKIRVPGENNSINSRMYIEPGSESSVVASDEQLQILQAVAQKVGKDIVLTKKLVDDENGVSKNGMYDGDKIYIRADLNENYMLAVALHEATHDLRANSPFEYQALCNFIMNYLVSKGENVNSLLDNIKDNWKDNVSTEDDVLEELVCQTVMAIATDEKAINTVLNIKENKNILHKVVNALKKIAQYTYDFMKGIGFDRHNLQAQAWLDDAKAIQNLAEKLSSALDNNRNVTTAQSTEQQKNNIVLNDDVRYSVSDDVIKNDAKNKSYRKNNKFDISIRDVEILRTIKRKTINKFESIDIQKAEKWARKFYDELKTKSPFFRAWFGDWRMYDKTPLVVVDIGEIYENQKGTFIIKDTESDENKWIVRISRNGIENTKSHSGFQKKSVKGLNNISGLIENAIYLDCEVHEHHSNNAKNDYIAFDHKFYSLGKDSSGSIGLYKITIEDMFQSKSNPSDLRFHNLKYLAEIEKVAEITKGSSPSDYKSEVVHYNVGDSTTKYTVADLFALVKKYDSDFTPNPVNKDFLNEDGTPKVFYHGTNAKWTTYDLSKNVNQMWGEGIYLTPYEERARLYGDNVMAFYVKADTNYRTAKTNGKTRDYTFMKKTGDILVYSPNQIKSVTKNIGTFDRNNINTHYSVDDTIRTDTEYMKAVENDDMETAQRLVDEAAKVNGYTIKVYHGTTNQQEKSIWNDKTKSYDTEYKKFTVFKKQYDEQVGHFFNDDVDNAGGYGSILYSVYLKMNKPFVIDCNGQNYASIVFDGKEMDTYEWADYAKRNGYDGIIFKNISDGVGYDDLSKLTTDYVVFNSNQIKSADPVTYDDKGDVIPLSKRFINYSVDIRYSVDDTIIDFNDDWFLDEDLFFEGTEEHINFEKVIKDSPADALNIIYNTASKTAITGISQFKDVQLDYKAYTSIARKVMKDYGIIKKHNPDVEAKIANTIRKYAELIESGNYSDGADVIEKLVLECKGYITLSGDYDKTVLQEEREAMLGYLSGKTLLITDYAEDFVRENYGNVAKYRRNMMGKVSVGLERNAKSMSNTMYMDDVISFVEENYPMFITDECDSVQGFQWLDNLLNNVLQPKFFNRYADGFYENADTTAIEMAFDMTTEVISAKAKQLVTAQKADKKQVRELTKARKIAIAEREALLKAKANNYRQLYKEERKMRVEQIKQMREKMQKQKQRSGKVYLSNQAKIEHLETQLDEKKMLLAIRDETIRTEYNERRDKTMYIERLGKMFDRLSKRLDGKANNNEYIPEILKKPILDVLRSFYVDPGTYKNGKKKNIPGYFGEWKNIVKIGDRVKDLTSEYEKLRPKQQYNPLGSNNADSSTKDFTQFDLNSLGFEEDTLKVLQNLSGFVDGKNIYDLTSDDLKDIYGAMLELEQTLKRAVEIIIDGQKTTIKEAAVKAVSEIKLVKDKSGSDSLLGLVQMGFNQFATSSLDPVRFARRISGYHEDSVFYKAMNEIHLGEKKAQWIEMQSTLPVMNVISEYSNKDIKALQTVDVNDFDFKDRDTGEHVKISQGMLLSIYLTNRQEDGHRHLVNENFSHYTLIPDLDLLNKNSIIADATKAKTRASKTKAHRIRLSKDDLIKINEYVESNRMLSEIAGAISQVYNVYLAGEINEVSMKKHGRKIATVKNYFPLKVDPDRPNSDPYDEPINVFMDMRMRSRGFTKNRQYSTAPLVIDDVLRVFSKSVKEVSKYCGLLIPIENFDKIYNSGDGYTTVRKIIGDKFGVPATHYINKIRGDLQNNQDGDFYNFLTKLQGNYMASVLLFNGGATLKNLSAFPTANKYFGTKNVSKASVVGGKQIKEMYDTYAQYTPYLWYRQQGNSTVVGEMSREHSFYKKWTDRIDIMGKVDTLVVGKLLYAAELHVEQTTELQRGTEEFYREVVRQWEKCIDETQPNNMVTSKPQYLRNKVIKILSFDAFRSQVQAIGNTIIDSVGEYSARSFEYKADKNTETKKAKNEALKKVARTFIGAIESYALNSLFQLLVDALRHKLDDYKDEDGKVTFDKIASKYLNYFTENFAGVFMWGEQTYEIISTAINHERFFGLEVMSLETINDGIEKAIKGDFLGFVSLFFDCFTGLPTGTAIRDIRSIYSYIVDWTKGYGDVVTNNKGQIEPSYFNYIIVRAKQNGETEKAEHFEDMWIDYLMDKKGKTKEQATETIKDKLVTALSVSDNDVELAAQAFANGDLETYETHLNKVIGYGFDSKDVKSAVDKVIKNIIADLKDKKITEKEDVIEDLKQQGFNDKGCEHIYNEMQNSTDEDSEEVASVFADTSEDKGVAYTYSDAFEALKSGDKDNYNHIKNYLIEEAGKEEKDIQSAMRNASRTDPLWAEYIKAYEDNDGTKMRELKAMLTNIYGSWDTAVEAMHRYQKRMKEKENK